MVTPKEIWNHRDGGWYGDWITERWPNLRGDGWRQTSLIQGAYAHARSGKEEVKHFGELMLEKFEASRQREEAILAALAGSGHEELLTTLETLHEQRMEAIAENHRIEMDRLNKLESNQTEIQTLVESFQAGDLTAEQIVDALGRRLAPAEGS